MHYLILYWFISIFGFFFFWRVIYIIDMTDLPLIIAPYNTGGAVKERKRRFRRPWVSFPAPFVPFSVTFHSFGADWYMASLLTPPGLIDLFVSCGYNHFSWTHFSGSAVEPPWTGLMHWYLDFHGDGVYWSIYLKRKIPTGKLNCPKRKPPMFDIIFKKI